MKPVRTKTCLAYKTLLSKKELPARIPYRYHCCDWYPSHFLQNEIGTRTQTHTLMVRNTRAWVRCAWLLNDNTLTLPCQSVPWIQQDSAESEQSLGYLETSEPSANSEWVRLDPSLSAPTNKKQMQRWTNPFKINIYKSLQNKQRLIVGFETWAAWWISLLSKHWVGH